MYLCRELTDHSLPAIAQRFGGRDHTTVLHAHRKVQRELLTDQSTRELVDGLVRELNGRLSPVSRTITSQRASQETTALFACSRDVQPENPHLYSLSHI